MRADLYTLVHKAQRFHLFQLANEIGGADLTQEEEAERISQRVRDMIEHLRDHARNEETYIHPLFRGAGVSVSNQLEGEHRDLETDMERLETILNERRWSDLYGEYTGFLGRYVVHLSEEEAAQREVLWAEYEDSTLLAVFNRFKSERSPQAARADLELMLPALSIAELGRVFLSMKASAPPKVFQGAFTLAEKLLPPQRWQELRAEIS